MYAEVMCPPGQFIYAINRPSVADLSGLCLSRTYNPVTYDFINCESVKRIFGLVKETTGVIQQREMCEGLENVNCEYFY